MKYKISENKNGISISISDTAGKKEKLLQAFTECQQGKCSCPTEEYNKLESLEIDQDNKSIALHLKSKTGTTISSDEIEKCLQYTTKRAEKDNND